ncbi:MAG: DUF2148 domain-containing protein [Dissulfuribacterales bacterium]
MARIKSNDATSDAVLQVAKLALASAYRAPQLTGKLKLLTEIVTGEDQDPIIEFFGEIAPISPVMYFDWETLKYFRDRGEPLILLLIGTDVTRSELGWNCGACGFGTCAEFNKYSKKHRSKGALWSGPSCIWKTLDFAAACDFACATAAQHKINCRPMGTIGAAAAGVGFMPESSAIIGVPIGPPGDFRYFSRPQNQKAFSYEQHRESLIRTSPTNWQAFPGSTKPCLKTRQDWWNDMEYVKWEPFSEEEKQFIQDTMDRVQKVSEKHTPSVSSWYKK